MQIQAARGKRYDDINITPMLDLAFVLLVIFIIMTTAQVQGIKVNLPKASSAVHLEADKTKAITIANDGQIYYEAFPVSLDELDLKLTEQKALTPEFPIVVKGDGTVQYQRVVAVLDLLRRLDLTKVGLVTGKPQKS
ncbi:MAG: biopolymer transporter ExbD [Rhizomicrobium sp.]